MALVQMAMDDLQRIQCDLERVIERDGKDGGAPTSTGASDRDHTPPHGPPTRRQRLHDLIHSRKFQVGIIVLVVCDVVLVLSELLFDLEVVHLESKTVSHVLHYCSISILSLFMLEISLRLFVMRLEFFKHKMEVFDAMIVIVSFILDVVFRDSDGATVGVGLLVLLRLWRVTRILNGIVLSVKRQAQKQIELERNVRAACEEELSKFQTYCTLLECDLEEVRGLLTLHAIPYTHKTHMRPGNTTSTVQEELNHQIKLQLDSAVDVDGGGSGSGGGVNSTCSSSGSYCRKSVV